MWDRFVRSLLLQSGTPVVSADRCLAAGDLIGRYTIVRQLGAGGMGVVYQARDNDLERNVALKVLPTEVMADAERRLRFLREARSAAAVSHRNIAMVHEVGEDGGRVFIAMELVRGESALGSTLDAKTIAGAGANAGLYYAREAERAAARGDHDLARRHAKVFVEAWGTADVKVPAVDRMRPLLAD